MSTDFGSLDHFDAAAYQDQSRYVRVVMRANGTVAVEPVAFNEEGTMEAPEKWPQPPCVKCGSLEGFSDPKYRHVDYVCDVVPAAEWLEFTCLSCGYVVREDTLDAKPRPINPPPPKVDLGGLAQTKRPGLFGWW